MLSRKPSRFASTIEPLESRIAPATVVHVGGSLTISHPDGALVVQTTAIPGEISISDGSGTESFTGIVSSVSIIGNSTGAAADAITFRGNVAAFAGNLSIKSGDGDDSIFLSGNIDGGVLIDTGKGTDSVTFNGLDVKVGKSFVVKDPGGASLVFDMNDRDLRVGGALTLTGVTTFDMGVANLLEVEKTMTITAPKVSVAPLTVLFSGPSSLVKGDLKITSSYGNDTLNLSGAINGNVVLNTGLGDDSIKFINVDVTVGKSLTLKDTGGKNEFDMNTRDLGVGGALMLSGISTFKMGAGSTLEVLKAMTIVASSTPEVGFGAVFDGTQTGIGGNLSIKGGIAEDVVSVTSKLTISGSLISSLGSSANTFVLTPTAGGTGIAGAFTYSGLEGVDVVVFGAQSVVDGKASLALGSGVNTFVDAATSLYHKDLVIAGGSNTNTCVVIGQIDGNLSVSFAAGGAGNTTVFTGRVGVDKKITYRSGNAGTLEVLTLAPAAPAVLNVDVKFGNGSSTFNLGPNVSLGGKLTGTGGTYTFNQGTALLLPSLKFVQYP